MTPSEKLLRYGPIVMECLSKSEPDKTHYVRCKDGVYSCTCRGWIFNKDRPKRCRHTDRAKLEDDRDSQPVVARPLVRPLVVLPVAKPKQVVTTVTRIVRKITFD
jgi:hypothetical protein